MSHASLPRQRRDSETATSHLGDADLDRPVTGLISDGRGKLTRPMCLLLCHPLCSRLFYLLVGNARTYSILRRNTPKTPRAFVQYQVYSAHPPRQHLPFGYLPSFRPTDRPPYLTHHLHSPSDTTAPIHCQLPLSRFRSQPIDGRVILQVLVHTVQYLAHNGRSATEDTALPRSHLLSSPGEL